MKLCAYYQAHVQRSQTLFFVATLRANEHVAFDRTLNKEQGIFEFFVPADQEQRFLALMAYYQQHSIITNLTKLPNRFLETIAEQSL